MSGLETEPRTATEPRKILGPRQQWFYLSILAGALGYAVFAHGARALLDWNISLLIIGLGVVAYWVTTPRSDVAPAMDTLLGLLALLVPAYIVFQLVPLPIFLVRLLSPERGRIVDNLGAVMPPDAFAALSVTPATTFAFLFRIIGYLLMFLLVRELTARSRQPRIVAIPLIVIAGLEAALGFAQNAAQNPGESLAVGTYVNRNHFAGLLEMILPIAIACAITLLLGRSRRVPIPIQRAAAGVVLLLAVVMLIAIVYSGSKMGFTACLGGLFCMAAVASLATIKGRKRWWGLALLGVLFLAVFARFRRIN